MHEQLHEAHGSPERERWYDISHDAEKAEEKNESSR